MYINLGLVSLKSCVEALAQGAHHVPYANSKLTMLLASGLGGNNKTSVIVCASQEEKHSSETINAFKFGQSCRQVSNTVRTQAAILGSDGRLWPSWILFRSSSSFCVLDGKLNILVLVMHVDRENASGYLVNQ